MRSREQGQCNFCLEYDDCRRQYDIRENRPRWIRTFRSFERTGRGFLQALRPCRLGEGKPVPGDELSVGVGEARNKEGASGFSTEYCGSTPIHRHKLTPPAAARYIA